MRLDRQSYSWEPDSYSAHSQWLQTYWAFRRPIGFKCGLESEIQLFETWAYGKFALLVFGTPRTYGGKYIMGVGGFSLANTIDSEMMAFFYHVSLKTYFNQLLYELLSILLITIYISTFYLFCFNNSKELHSVYSNNI